MAVGNRTAKTKEKIIDAAQELFYRQGYHTTVVNQIIQEAGISKPTFYSHFPSKEDLCVTYLRTRRENDLNMFRDLLRTQTDPYERFMILIRRLKTRMVETEFRGCGFFNMLVEITDEKSPILREIRYFNDSFREMLREVTLDLIQSNEKYSQLDPEQIADTYYLIFGGAIMFSQEYQEKWPLDLAVRQVANLVA